MMPLPILLAAVFLGTGNCSSEIVHGNFFLQWPPRFSCSLSEIRESVIEIFWDEVFLDRSFYYRQGRREGGGGEEGVGFGAKQGEI